MNSPVTQLGEVRRRGEKNRSFYLEVSAEQGGGESSFNSLLSLPDVWKTNIKEYLILQSTLTFLRIMWADL